MELRLSSRYFYLIPQLQQHIRDLLAMLSLNFDDIIFDRFASAAFIFYFFR